MRIRARLTPLKDGTVRLDEDINKPGLIDEAVHIDSDVMKAVRRRARARKAAANESRASAKPYLRGNT